MLRIPSAERHAAMRLHADLLEEAKLRINVVEAALSGRIPLAGPFLHELCFLQLRFLCELIALGCLVVHGDIEAAKKADLRKQWSAEKIIERLAAIHAAFYPVPHIQEKTQTGFHLTNLEDGFLTKDDLVELYSKCGSHLHRGSLKKILKSRQPTQFNFPDVLEPL